MLPVHNTASLVRDNTCSEPLLLLFRTLSLELYKPVYRPSADLVVIIYLGKNIHVCAIRMQYIDLLYCLNMLKEIYILFTQIYIYYINKTKNRSLFIRFDVHVIYREHPI